MQKYALVYDPKKGQKVEKTSDDKAYLETFRDILWQHIRYDPKLVVVEVDSDGRVIQQ